MSRSYDTIILGAGAAGLFCASFAGAKGGRVLLIDHAKGAGEKIRISGGGRCNFTNTDAGPENYLSQNPHFAKSALARFTQWDFISMVSEAGIAWHEKTLGQLFCDGKSTEIIRMLLDRVKAVGAELRLGTEVRGVSHDGMLFRVETSSGVVAAKNLVLATGGKSIPKMGATGLAYDIARQFGHEVTETRPALVPFTFPEGRFAGLSGVSLPARVRNARASFDEAVLFTHRGLSGPAILQISSYWREGEEIRIDLSPGRDLFTALREQRQAEGRRNLTTELARLLPARLVEHLAQEMDLNGNLADQSDTRLRETTGTLHDWPLTPGSTEGYRTAEVTLGGIDTQGLSSKTMESKYIPGLYVIGEAVDVTGWLGGYNFQWAWSSGFAAGTAIAG